MKQKRYGKLALFLTAMLWGTTFAIGKIATEVFSASSVIALRFTVASIVLIIVLAGDTSPGKSAFLCLLGIGILSLQGGLSMSSGDILTVLSGVPCAVNIVISSIMCWKKSPSERMCLFI